MSVKKIIIFFSLFFLILSSFVYINARKENRKDYHFVITKISENAKGRIVVGNSVTEFGFTNFDSYKINVQKEDSLVKRTFSKKVYIYRKAPKTNKYRLLLLLNESGTFSIDLQ